MARAHNAAGMRIEVLLDGRRVAVAGVDEFGVVSAIISWVKRQPGKVSEAVRSRKGFDEAAFLREECTLEVSGLDSIKDKHLSWARKALRPGAEVTIRVLGPGDYKAAKRK